MTRFMSAVAIASLVFACASLSAQSKTSFAGKWTLVPDPNAAAAGGGRGRGMAGGLGPELTAAQDDKTLTVTTNNPQLGELKTVYNLDGSESKNPLNFGGQTVDRVSKVKWDGAKLVITTTTQAGEQKRVLSLEGGNLVVDATTPARDGGAPTTTKITFKKK